MRGIVSIAGGYGVFALGVAGLFHLTGWDALFMPTWRMTLASLAGGVALAFGCGWLTARLEGQKATGLTVVLALLIEATALAWLFVAPGGRWVQMLVMFVFAPTAIAGGMYRDRQIGHTETRTLGR